MLYAAIAAPLLLAFWAFVAWRVRVEAAEVFMAEPNLVAAWARAVTAAVMETHKAFEELGDAIVLTMPKLQKFLDGVAESQRRFP